DNLPLGCTAEKIGRFARKFGTVVEVRVPRSSSRPVSSSYGTIEVGKHSRSFAFLQFTEPEACKSMCEAYACKAVPERNKEECPLLVPLLQRLLFHIRARRRRKRRSEVGPHTVIGSLSDYFAKIQVFSFARYMELRKEYIALRRQSDSQASRLTRKDSRFSEFASRLCDGKLGRKLESYRDCYWNADMAEEE
ncbi:hypothetical protein OSTOST_16103, partial [Ostertagia ostertagi]